MVTARWVNTPYKVTIGVCVELNRILYSAKQKECKNIFQRRFTCSPDGVFIGLMSIFDTDVSHIDAMRKRGLHLAPNTNATRNSTSTKNPNNKVT